MYISEYQNDREGEYGVKLECTDVKVKNGFQAV